MGRVGSNHGETGPNVVKSFNYEQIKQKMSSQSNTSVRVVP